MKGDKNAPKIYIHILIAKEKRKTEKKGNKESAKYGLKFPNSKWIGSEQFLSYSVRNNQQFGDAILLACGLMFPSGLAMNDFSHIQQAKSTAL